MKRFTLGRLFRIYERIKEGTFPDVSLLMEEEEVSERTIKRDIQTLKYSLNAPIAYSKSRKGYYLTKNWEFPFPELSAGEILTLLIANNILKELKGTPLFQIAKELSKKLEKLLPEHISISSNEIEKMLSISFQHITPKEDILNTFNLIFEAIKKRKRIFIKYYTISRDEITERKLDPYHIYNYQGIWYLVAFCHKRDDVRDFAIDRIKDIKILNERFNYQPNFNLKTYLEETFRIYKGNEEEIKLYFDSFQSKWIRERIWSKKQEIIENNDGSLILKIYGNREEIKRWFFGFGSHCIVLEPKSLKDEIIKEIEELKNLYSK